MKRPSPLFQVLAPGLVAALGIAWVFVVQPSRDLDALARDTCDEIDGGIVLYVGQALRASQAKAGRLGFTASDLGDRMRAQCPGTMEALTNWQAEQAAREAEARIHAEAAQREIEAMQAEIDAAMSAETRAAVKRRQAEIAAEAAR